MGNDLYKYIQYIWQYLTKHNQKETKTKTKG